MAEIASGCGDGVEHTIVPRRTMIVEWERADLGLLDVFYFQRLPIADN
jgi:hypothetical protein